MADKKRKDHEKKSDDSSMALQGYPGLDMIRDETERMMQHFRANDWTGGMLRSPLFQLPMLKDWMQMSPETPFAALLNAPKADMSETDGEYELSVELPGLDENDVELTLTDRCLVLKGEKRSEKETKDKDYHFSERSYGSVRRQFPLPANVDRDAMKASFAKGVLKVTLPKTAETKGKSRRIEVNPG